MSARDLTDSPAAVDALNERAFALRHEDARAALAVCLDAAAMATRCAYDKGQAFASLRLALLRFMLGHARDDYEAPLLHSVELMRTLGDEAGEAEAVNLWGVIHHTRGEYQAAVDHFKLTLALRRSLADAFGETAALSNLGMALREQGRHAEALETLLQSLELANRVGEPRATAYAHLNIGKTLAELGDAATAQGYFREALALVAPTSDRGLECTAHAELGKAQLSLLQHEDALQHLHRAWQLSEQTANSGDQARVMCALGALHQSLGAFNTAEERLQGALTIAQRRNERTLVCEVQRLRARNHLLQGQPQAAFLLLAEALSAALDQGATLQAAQVHELLAQAYEAAGDLAQALAHLREFQRCRDAVQGQSTLRRVHELLWQQQMAGLRQEAQSQRSLNESLAHALELARQAEQEKSTLLAEVAAQAQALQQLAREDGLTQVANRRWFDTQWPKELERARRHQHPLAVAMVDIDDFKSINDRFSHGVGDVVLQRVAQVMRDNCRSNDLVARYGGEEFVLMFVETPLAGARHTCEKLRQLIQAVDWTAVHEGLPPVTVSIGLACWTHDAPQPNVLGQADEQLYRAKRSGKNRLCSLG
jgi:diguanylate cyclase (GGDEF)-like protein